MKDTWYADQRDLLKWSALAYLAQRQSLDLIVQIPFLRPGDRPFLRDRNAEISIPPEVWNFFRNVRGVRSLGKRLGRCVIVFDEEFVPRKREEYRHRIAAKLAMLSKPKVVLVDPDTGIEPKEAKPEHATKDDIRAIWNVLKPGDWIVLYQHASRRKAWRKEASTRFGIACRNARMEMFSGPGVLFIGAPKF